MKMRTEQERRERDPGRPREKGHMRLGKKRLKWGNLRKKTRRSDTD